MILEVAILLLILQGVYWDETPELVKFYEIVSQEAATAPGTLILYTPRPSDHSDGHHGQPAQQESQEGFVPDLTSSVSDEGHNSSFPESALEPLSLTYAPEDTQSQAIESPSSCRSITGSSMFTPVYNATSFEPFTDHEADLMRNFTDNMAMWADVTDIERHFEIEVPRKALNNTMLRYAIFAFSARHLAQRGSQSDLADAIAYHNRALQLLIPQLSGPEESLTEDVFAAVVILRLDEEWHEIDNRFHLTGATRILNSISTFLSSGGMGEAAAWLCLRQDIAISIASLQPLHTHLDRFRTCHSIKQDNDVSWTLRVTLLLAATLTHAFLPPSSAKQSMLRNLDEDLQKWQSEKPLSYEPIRSMPKSKERGRRVPTLRMLSPFHVLASLYYHISKILILSASLLVLDDRISGVGDFQRSRRTEKLIREHMLAILGLGRSNPTAEVALYTTMHALEAWGGVIRNDLDREAAQDFLKLAESKLGWKMEKALRSLERAWEDDQDSD